MMYKREQTIKQNPERKNVLFVGCWQEEAKDQPDPLPLVQFLFYAIRTNVQAKRQKEFPLLRMTGTRGSQHLLEQEKGTAF